MRGFLLLRANLLHIGAILVSALLLTLAFNSHGAAKRDLTRLRAEAGELSALTSEFLLLKRKVQGLEGRMAMSRVQGVLQAVDEIFAPLDLKSRVKSVKQLGSKQTAGALRQEALVQAEDLSLNEVVNILYGIRTATMLVSIRKVTIKKSFENPELVDMALTLVFLKSKR